jgi:glycosyltransferase
MLPLKNESLPGQPPLLTIVTVGFNSAATVGDTLESLRRAFAAVDRSLVEYVFVDGGSTDDTLSILGRHPDVVDQLLSEPDRGMYDAMNKGAGLARGRYLWYINSDDMLASPEALSAVLDGLAASPDVLVGNIVIVDKDRTAIVRRDWRVSMRLAVVQLGWYPPHPGFVIRADLFRKLGGFDRRYAIAADIDFMTRALLQKPAIGHVRATLVRMRAGGVSNGSFAAILQANRECVDSLRRANVSWPWLVVTLKVLRKALQRSHRIARPTKSLQVATPPP